MKPVILVTRKLPDAVEDRLRRDYDARLNPEDVLYSRDELIERARAVDAILPCHTEKFHRGRARPIARARARHCGFPPGEDY
jgi:lactate dehydrogenase-like 2-hydroxyacid dehydrogenase